MLSLYIHIPFCNSKCAYCSFTSFPISELTDSELLITNYVEALKKEIDHYAETLTDKSLKTLYFWWGTPSRIGVDRIIDIIEHLKIKFNFEHIAELSIELNPNPMDEVLNFVDVIQKKYKDFPRVRFSFGIQSLDDEVLKITGRAYNFTQIAEFLRELVKHKKEHTVFNFDFIAFGKFQVSKLWNKQLRHEFKRNFLEDFLNSGYADSISLYTLEGLSSPQPSPLHEERKYYGSDDEIMEEFLILKQFLENAGYQRYEISNFAHAGKASIHNMAYRTMENYLWLGLSASSFFNKQSIENNGEAFERFNIWAFQPFGLRRTNTVNMQDYLQGKRVDEQQVQSLNESDLLIEEFFLRLRTREWIADLGKFKNVLIANYEWLLINYQKEGLVEFDGTKLRLTDEGMNVYNGIVTDLLEKL